MPNEQQESGERVSVGAIGSIEKFIPETDQDFEDYLERMGHFFELNNITEDKRKKSAFITLAGPICLKKLKAAIQPALISSKTYKEITEVLKNMFAPKRSVMAERFKFYDRRQKEDENISEFVAELKL
uniref:Paraneoplastic antigen Ma-like C-terminal domain-containing protein n=1 Tax=Phlebotomus papatasi TaxID=29031 RepID=A0A1B0GPV0_PHLPP